MQLRSIVCVLLLTACTTPSAVVVNGASKHVTQTDKDHSNFGLGVRSNDWEVGFYDNSRVFESYSYYMSKRVWERGRLFFDVGVSLYDNRSNYTPFIAPITMLGVGVGPLEIGVTPTDLLIVRGVLE